MLIIVKGVKIPGGKEVKISAFADDTNFFCSTQQSIRRILILFELFGLASGSITNLEKSSVLFLGNQTQTNYMVSRSQKCRK